MRSASSNLLQLLKGADTEGGEWGLVSVAFDVRSARCLIAFCHFTAMVSSRPDNSLASVFIHLHKLFIFVLLLSLFALDEEFF